MGYRNRHLSPMIAVAAALLAFGSGCATDDTTTKSTSKKLDVLKPGVLPPPQETLNASPAPGGVVPAGGAPTALAAPIAPGPVAAAPSALTMPKLNLHPEKKVPATQIGIAWQNNIEYLPDPTRNGAMGAGLAGQVFLLGGPKLEPVQADGVLTVDLVDETPRPAGQPAATPERWQFNKEMLRNLRTSDDMWGKHYVVFLPWPGYRPDITRVKISARYDPESGYTLYAPPSVVSLSAQAAKIDYSSSSTAAVVVPGLHAQPFNTMGTLPTNGAPLGTGAPPTTQPPSNFGSPIPLGGSATGTAAIDSIPQGAMPAPSGPVGAAPLGTAPGAAFQPTRVDVVPPAPPFQQTATPVVPPAPPGAFQPSSQVVPPAPAGQFGPPVVPPEAFQQRTIPVVPPAPSGGFQQRVPVVPPAPPGEFQQSSPVVPPADPQQSPMYAPRQ